MAESDKRLDLIAEQGATFRQTIIVYTKPGGSTPQDLTNCSARMQIRSGYASTSTLLATLSTANGGITLGGTSGSITLYLSAAAMSAFSVRSSNQVPPSQVYYYDLIVTFPSGDVVRVTLGQFTVYAAVTQPQ